MKTNKNSETSLTDLFDTKIVFTEKGVLASVFNWEIFGYGETYENAMEDLVVELRDYAEDYLGDKDFQNARNGESHLGALERFVAIPESEQIELLRLDSEKFMDIELKAINS
jgi:hypothetical protein